MRSRLFPFLIICPGTGHSLEHVVSDLKYRSIDKACAPTCLPDLQSSLVFCVISAVSLSSGHQSVSFSDCLGGTLLPSPVESEGEGKWGWGQISI